MNLPTELYATQNPRWPQTGRVILAHFDENSVIVYQAYRTPIGRFAAQHGYFGGEFKMDRMTWIKPNFLWMMYRSGWGTKEDQEVTLAIRLHRWAFDQILASAVHSSYDSDVYPSEAEWRRQISTSDVRLQWDPDRAPNGSPLERSAIQLGLRGPVVARYAHEWIVGIDDISDFVREQRELLAEKRLQDLMTPVEHVYQVMESSIATRLGVASTAAPEAEAT